MILVSGEQLAARGGGQLLDGLRSRVTALNVVRRSGTCPVVSMRGVKTFVGAKSVGVYVDGTPMMDTCILDQLRVFDIDSVEVYPSGVTNRPGYRANPNGLILVFLAGAVE